MKAQVSLLVLSLVPPLMAQTPLPANAPVSHKPSLVNTTLIEDDMTLVSEPSPFEPEASDVSCAAAPAVLFKADSNEASPQIRNRYARAQSLMLRGAWRRARLVLERGIAAFPESRHLRMLYADLLWYQSQGGQDQELLEQAAQEAVRAMEIGLGFGIVDYRLIDRLSLALGKTGDAATLDRLFSQALALDAGPVPRRHYALGLSRMGSPRAEEAFKAAVALEAEGDAHVDYGEWLLDQGRFAEALEMLPRTPGQIYYLQFLRGLALERSNRSDEARSAYNRFRDFSASFPAPARFRISGSTLQRDSGVRFDDETSTARSLGGGMDHAAAAITDQQGIKGLSYTIWGEARGESYGGMLAIGWVARTRVVRGNVAEPLTCPAVTRTGTTLADWYKSVMCQSGAFDGACAAWCSNPGTTSCTSTASTDSAAYDVFYGTKADPVSGHCPGGVSVAGSLCAGTQTCYGDFYTYRLRSPLFNLGISASSACQAHSCAPHNYGKVCGNGGTLENCFYGNDACSGTKRFGYSGTLTSTTTALVSEAYPHSTAGTHKGHLEGPEVGADFDLEFQQASASTGPWTTIASSRRSGSVEELDVAASSGGYFRWRAVRYSGSGDFRLCTRRP